MTAEVKERHRRAAAEALHWNPKSIAGFLSNWIVTGDAGAFTCHDDDVAQLVSTAQALADAEERGRMEERVRCLRAVFAPTLNLPGAAAYNAIVATAERIAGAPVQDGDWEDPSILAQRGLDAARKELGE